MPHTLTDHPPGLHPCHFVLSHFLFLVFLILFLLFFLFLTFVATVLGTVTKLKVAFNVQDLQVFQPPEGAFHHGAHGQLVEPEWWSTGQRQEAWLMPSHLPSSEGKGGRGWYLGRATASLEGGCTRDKETYLSGHR